MKTGKISEPILKRSVLKYIKPNNECVQKGAAIGADCALFSKNESMMAAATASVSGEKGSLQVSHAIMRAANNLAAGGAVAMAVQIHIMMPERAREIALKRMMEAAAETAAQDHQSPQTDPLQRRQLLRRMGRRSRAPRIAQSAQYAGGAEAAAGSCESGTSLPLQCLFQSGTGFPLRSLSGGISAQDPH